MALNCGDLDNTLKSEINELCSLQETSVDYMDTGSGMRLDGGPLYCEVDPSSGTGTTCPDDSDLCPDYPNCQFTYFDNSNNFDFTCKNDEGTPCSFYSQGDGTVDINSEWVNPLDQDTYNSQIITGFNNLLHPIEGCNACCSPPQIANLPLPDSSVCDITSNLQNLINLKATMSLPSSTNECQFWNRDNVDDGTLCNDGDDQTVNDLCITGTCIGTSICTEGHQYLQDNNLTLVYGPTCDLSNMYHGSGLCEVQCIVEGSSSNTRLICSEDGVLSTTDTYTCSAPSTTAEAEAQAESQAESQAETQAETQAEAQAEAQADVAMTEASQAQTAADAAQALADTALLEAQLAQAEADTALADAQLAQAEADLAQAAADEAQSLADSALESARVAAQAASTTTTEDSSNEMVWVIVILFLIVFIMILFGLSIKF